MQPPKEGCFIIEAIVQYAEDIPLISDYVSGTLAGLTVLGISYIFAKAANKRQEMKHISSALEKAIGELGDREHRTAERLLQTIDKMADALAPAARSAVAPLGQSARTLKIEAIGTDAGVVTVDEADRDAILSKATLRVDDERTYEVKITELDMDTGSCRVNLASEPEDRRHAAKITDPAVKMRNNPYALHMAAMNWLSVRAKATIRDEVIERLFISNTVGADRDGDGDGDFQLS